MIYFTMIVVGVVLILQSCEYQRRTAIETSLSQLQSRVDWLSQAGRPGDPVLVPSPRLLRECN